MKSRTNEVKRREALQIARGYAYEVAANYSHSFVVFMSGLLGRLWNRLYDGVEVANFSSLQGVDEGSEIVYVPCHRSHMDYLLLSYVVYHKGFAVPHIAAGINLNMPVVGPLLRRGGAFFLRRSFGGNAMYTAVFTRYLGTILARGHSHRVFHRRRPQPHGSPAATEDRHAGNDGTRLRAHAGTSRRVRAGVLRLRAAGRRTHLHRRVVGTAEGEGIGLRHAAHAAGTAQPLRQGVRELRRAAGACRSCWRGTPRSGSPGEPSWPKRSPRGWRRLCDDLARQIMARINAAACVTPVNLLGTGAARHPAPEHGRSRPRDDSSSCTRHCCARRRTRRASGSRRSTASR